ncbi:MAG: hypothetical protein IT381_08415 [Deltaproteobacteria bacterium]|nr:hypothetical protein [Deltaproteobacteria bacterium]
MRYPLRASRIAVVVCPLCLQGCLVLDVIRSQATPPTADNHRVRYLQNPNGAQGSVIVSTVAGGQEIGLKTGALPARLNSVRGMTLFAGEPYFFSENSLLRVF